MIRRAARRLYLFILRCEFRRAYRRGDDCDAIAVEMTQIEREMNRE